MLTTMGYHINRYYVDPNVWYLVALCGCRYGWKITIHLLEKLLHSYAGLCSTQIFRVDSTLTHVTIQVTQLWLNSTLNFFFWLTQLRLNSNPKFANLTQLRLNSNPKFANLTQLRLNSFESELSQIWLTTHHILPSLAKSCWPGGGGCGRT